MGELSYTVGGDSNLVSFKSAARVPITSLKAHFKPKQDLHGYSKPWPAGGGKNLIGNSFTTGKTINMNGEIITNTGGMITDYISVSSVSYVWSGINKYTDNVWNYRVHGYDENKDWIEQITYQTVNKDASYNISFTPTDNIKYIRLSFNEQTNNNQIEKGSAATSYEPYENICPIEGWNECDVWHEPMYIPLPNEYQRVEYLATSQTNPKKSKIKTGIIGNNKTIVIKYTMTKRVISGSYPTMIVSSYRLNDDSVTPCSPWAAVYYETESGNNSSSATIIPTQGNINIPNTYTVKFNSTNNYILCGGWSDNFWTKCGRYYSFTIYDNDTILFNGVPCYRKLDDMPGLFDVVSNSFFTSDNADDFTCGPDIELDKIHINFPVIGKNKFELVPLSYDEWSSEGFSTGYLDRMNPQIDLENKNITVTCLASGDTILYRKTHYPPGTYTLSYDMTYSSGHTNTPVKRMVVICFKEDGTIMTNEDISISGLTWNKYYKGFFNIPGTFTIPNNISYFMICFGIAADTAGETATFSNIQLELGSTATSYVPYSNNNTVYGGYIDLATGALMQTWGSLDLGSLDWWTQTYENAEWLRATLPIDVWQNTWYPNVTSSLNNHPPHFFVDRFKIVAGSAIYYGTAGDNVLGMDWRSTIRIKCDLYKQDASAFKAAMNGVILYYEYLTPVQVAAISPINCKALLGQNNIWSDTSDITEVSYAIHDTAPIRAAKKRMVAENDKHYRKVLWNQMAGPMTSQYWVRYNKNVTSIDFIDDYAEITITATTPNGYTTSIYTANEPSVYIDHYYYASYMIEPLYSNGQFYMELGGGATTGSMSASANEWNRLSSYKIKGLRTGNGRLYVPNFVPNTYQVGNKVRIKNAVYVDLTKMFGYGNEPIGVEFEKMCAINNIDLTTYHPIDSGTEQIWCIPDHNTDEYITVNWNQQCKTLTTSNYKPQNSNYASISAENGVMTTTILQDVSEVYQSSFISNYQIAWDASHRYYYKQEINSSTNSTYYLIYKSRCGAYQTLPSNTWITLEAIASPESTDSTPIFLAYNVDKAVGGVAGASCQVRNPILIDLTQMFGAGNEPTTVAELREACLKNNINLDEAQPYTTGSTIIWKK